MEEIKFWPTEKMRVIDLKMAFAPYNPRVDLKPGMPKYESIVNSIKEHGFADYSIVYNKATKTLVGGHQRVKVLEERFGLKEIPNVVIVDIPDVLQEKEMNLALNHAEGLDDKDMTEKLLKEIYEASPDRIQFTGFELGDVEKMFKDVKKVKDEEFENLGKFDPEEEFDACCPKCGFEFNLKK